MEEKVLCSKYKEELPKLAKAPFPGPLGKKILNSVSKKAWDEWQEMQIKVLNEYRLEMSNPEHYRQLMDSMMSYLGLAEGGVVPEVENAERGRGTKALP
jgi:Fe-S cluster biosynthesis and repair protein YggX